MSVLAAPSMSSSPLFKTSMAMNSSRSEYSPPVRGVMCFLNFGIAFSPVPTVPSRAFERFADRRRLEKMKDEGGPRLGGVAPETGFGPFGLCVIAALVAGFELFEFLAETKKVRLEGGIGDGGLHDHRRYVSRRPLGDVLLASGRFDY